MNVSRRLDTPAGHADIQQNNVGHSLVRDSQRILVAFALIDDLETISRLQCTADAFAQQRVVIDNGYGDGGCWHLWIHSLGSGSAIAFEYT